MTKDDLRCVEYYGSYPKFPWPKIRKKKNTREHIATWIRCMSPMTVANGVGWLRPCQHRFGHRMMHGWRYIQIPHILLLVAKRSDWMVDINWAHETGHGKWVGGVAVGKFYPKRASSIYFFAGLFNGLESIWRYEDLSCALVRVPLGSSDTLLVPFLMPSHCGFEWWGKKGWRRPQDLTPICDVHFSTTPCNSEIFFFFFLKQKTSLNW